MKHITTTALALLLALGLPAHAGEVHIHLAGGDGYVTMADGRPMYIFGYADVTGVPPGQVMEAATLAAVYPAPPIGLDQGDELFLELTNVGMAMRPDLFDGHTVHWHGFPNAAPIFDGIPDASISVNMGATLTYYYNVVRPGTYIYHCHVEATEHMQMGMLGTLYVRPSQNNLPDGTNLNGFIHHTGYRYVFNDGDGSTVYDVEFPLAISSFDPVFHDADELIQPLPFISMKDTYPLLNGRGYPDTVNPNPLPAPAQNGGQVSQLESALIEANQGQKILLRITQVSITRYFGITSLGIPMRVVGHDASFLRGPDGTDLTYTTSSLHLGGGDTRDVILDTAGVPPGRYFLYTSNLNYLSNDEDDFGGLMTEIVIH